MNLIFADKAWEDYLYWQKNNKQVLKKINTLIKEIKREPYKGLGEPEMLKYSWSGYYSRRISLEHRLVYKVVDNSLLIAQCRYHY